MCMLGSTACIRLLRQSRGHADHMLSGYFLRGIMCADCIHGVQVTTMWMTEGVAGCSQVRSDILLTTTDLA